jgi:hypothetical protein
MTVVGDVGCPGIDVDQWQKDNRVPLFPGKVNRWILVRTLRDDPTPEDLKTTLAATFSKWFKGTPFDPVLPFKLERVSKEHLSFPNPARTRLQIPGVPTVRPGEVVWLEVSFAYRGQQIDMPWPVRTGAAVQLDSSARCPSGADWMLDSAAVPTVDAPPEKSTGQKAGDTLSDGAAGVTKGLGRMLWVPLALVGVGVVLYFAAARALLGSSEQHEEAA